MRLLVDVHGIAWEEAWRITTGTLNYTNHTLLPEALETWPVELMERLLPRHMQIIYLINSLHLEQLAERPAADATSTLAARLADRRDAAAGACAWATSPSSARTGSTASRRCTPS